MKYLFTFLLASVLFASSVFAQDLSILLVNDSKGNSRVDSLKNAIIASGYTYALYDATTEGAAPTLAMMEPYNLVMWYTGNDYANLYFWNGDETENTDLKTYLDNGGMLWVQGVDFLKDRYTSKPVTFVEGDFVYDYLGVELYFADSHTDDGTAPDGLPQMDVVPDNGICTFEVAEWRWSTMWYADACLPTSNAKPIYKMGPDGYDLEDYYCAIYNETEDYKVLSFFVETSGYKAPREETGYVIMKEVLDYFNQFATINTPVTSFTVESEGGATVITENDGTLQFTTTFLPVDATYQTVTWRIQDGSANASIDQSGLLVASGTSDGNGTVTVIATANDNFDITETFDVTVSNQSLEGFAVLLVNDNARNSRYLDLDIALTNSEYSYKIFNTVTKGTIPTVDYLELFDMVVWYTGNDGVDLYFWDADDVSNEDPNINCNAPLKEYADNGGTVWLLGLDFFYDVYGGTYEEHDDGETYIKKFEAGDFAYDYLGISHYWAQTNANDGGTGVTQLDIAEENTITTIDPITWSEDVLKYADALNVTENAVPLYYLGPNTYDFSLFYAAVLNKNADATFLTFTFAPALMETQDDIDLMFQEVIDYFNALATSIPENLESETFEMSAYPNPATDKAYIAYTISSPEDLKLTVFDNTGKVMHNKVIGTKTAGNHIYELNLSNFSSGVYYYQLSTGHSVETNKITVVR